MRSWHDYTNFCSVFEYMHALPHIVATAGRLIQNYPSTNNTTTYINNHLVKYFIETYFHLYEDDIQENGKLWPFSECLFARFLMHFNEFSKFYYNASRKWCNSERKCNIRIMISNSEINISSSPSTFLEKSWIEWIYLHTWHHSRWTKLNRSRMFLIFIQWETIFSGVHDKLN